MEITDSEGNKLPGEALEKFDKTWHEGYHWFSNLHKSDYATLMQSLPVVAIDGKIGTRINTQA